MTRPLAAVSHIPRVNEPLYLYRLVFVIFNLVADTREAMQGMRY